MTECVAPLSETLDRVENEIMSLIERILDLESIASDFVDVDVDEASVALQDFDLVIQSLQALTIFLGSIRQEIPQDQKIDIFMSLKKVHLGAMAIRLSGGSEPIKDQAITGKPSVELF